MMKRVLSLAIATVLCMLIIVICGCTADRANLVDKSTISVETAPSEKFEILWTDVYQDGEDFVVYGVMRRRSHTRYPLRAHVHVSIVAADGTILQETRTPDMYVSKRQSGKGINWTRFKVRLAERPTAGSRVNILAHSV